MPAEPDPEHAEHRREECEAGERAERVERAELVASENRTRRVVARERQWDDRGEEPPEPTPVDRHRVLARIVAAVRERVPDLERLDRPERARRLEHDDAE